MLNDLSSRTKKLLFISILILIFCAIFVAFIIGMQMNRNNVKISTDITGFGLEDIGKLSTQAAYYSCVQQISDDMKIFGVSVPLTDSNYVFGYDGIIEAGFDFSKIIIEHLPEEDELIVHMPDVEILNNTVDESSLRIYSVKESIYTPLSLEKISQSRIDMEKEGEEKAIAQGILDAAKKNAELLIKTFVSRTLNTNKTNIVFQY